MTERLLLSLDEMDLGATPWIAALQRPSPQHVAPDLRADVRLVAQREWEDRAAAEYVGVMIVRRLHGLLVDLNAPMDLQTFALTMMLQEQEHTNLCMAAARSLGSDGAVSFDLGALQQARSDLPLDEQLLRMLATTFMVGEVTAFALLSHSVRALPASSYRDVLRTILRDEVGHARIGQTILIALKQDTASTWARYPGDARVASWVAEAQADLRKRDVVEPETVALHRHPEASRQLASVGVPPSDAFRRAYLAAIDDDVATAMRQVLPIV